MTHEALWWHCLACGAWRRAQPPSSCLLCGSSRLERAERVGRIDGSTGGRLDGSAIRVIVELEVRSDGYVGATRLHTERLSALRDDRALLERLDGEARARLRGADPTDEKWLDLRAAGMEHLVAHVDGLLRPRWPGQRSAGTVPVELMFRVVVLDRDRSWSTGLGWVEIVSLTEALARNARQLTASALEFDFHGTCLSLDEGGDRLRLSLERRMIRIEPDYAASA
jgi:hypothetical protein